ncbi:MAG: hypothetical protein ACU0BK_14415 [Shimia sp.]|uniref:hypothetical protein n=1 Tax=Shimia sp. TaxID=1954381 RepID=UPI004057FA0A
MSRWTDQFDNHAIRETLRQSREWVDSEFEDIDSDHQSEKRRLSKVIDSIGEVVDGMDPEFFPEAQLTTLNNQLRHQNFWNQLSTYSTNGKVQHLKSANDHVNNQIANVYQLAGMVKQPESRKAIRSVEAAYEAFSKAIETSKNGFEKTAEEKAAELSDLKTKTSELENSLSALKSTTDTQIATWQKEFTKAQTARIEEHSQAQIVRSKEYEKALEEFKTSSASDRVETTEKHDAALKKAFDEYVQDVKAKTDEINTKHEEILTLHGLVTTDGVAGGYKKAADGEWWAATIWSGISMLCFGIVLAWVLFKGKLGFGIAASTPAVSIGATDVTDATNAADANGLAETVGTALASGFDWPLVATTISVTAVALVAAQFAGRQSRVHRMNEQRLRWFSFEIAAIDPFISTLKTEDQQSLKKQLTEKLFGQDRVIEDGSGKGKGVEPQTLKTVLEIFKSAKE